MASTLSVNTTTAIKGQTVLVFTIAPVPANSNWVLIIPGGSVSVASGVASCSVGPFSVDGAWPSSFDFYAFVGNEPTNTVTVSIQSGGGAYTIRVRAPTVAGSGSTNPVPGDYIKTDGETFSVFATPATVGDVIYVFSHWQIAEGNFSANPYSFTVSPTMIGVDRYGVVTLTPVFVASSAPPVVPTVWVVVGVATSLAVLIWAWYFGKKKKK